MPDLLTLYASSQPGKLAVVDDRPGSGVVTWTYAQLEAEANRLANALVSLGVGPTRSRPARSRSVCPGGAKATLLT